MEQDLITALEAKLLGVVNAEDYRPVKPKVIAKKLGLDAEERRILRRIIKRLAKQGKVRYAANHVVHAANPIVDNGKRRGQQTPSNEIFGVFQRAAAGFGFVRPDGARAREQDIFVPRNHTSDAADGDRVRVELRGGRRGDERRRGAIVEVVKRAKNQFVGVYSEARGLGIVRVDGRKFRSPIPVGDAGAKNATTGDKVVIELVRYPDAEDAGEAVITEVLGPRGAPEVDTLTIIREYELPGPFAEEVLEDARQQASRFQAESIEPPRRDLRELTVLTIDPKDARDFDDAISLEVLENGHLRLGVHIADVSHFVPHNSALDIEARNRGTSVYLPDRVIPMLPEIISNNLASLQPDRVRYTKSLFLEFTPDGVRTDFEFCSAAIRSDRRFNYEEVDDFLENREGWREKLTEPVFTLLERMHSLAMTLRRRRLNRGALELHLPEIKIDFDAEHEVSGAHLVENTESHQIIEEFMLSANEAVAIHLHSLDLHFLRRIHESPQPRKLKQLTSFIHELGLECGSLQNRHEIQRVINETAGRADSYAVHFAVLRSMQKAIYSPDPEGHFALNIDHYCHFTSPIRRYPDLVVHRMLGSLEREVRPTSDHGAQTLLAQHCSDREQRAEAAERELTKLKLLNFMAKRVGKTMLAVITGVEEFGLFAQGVKIPAEGFLSIDAIENDHYEFDRATHTLMGRKAGNQFRLGDLIKVEILHVDVDRRELEFRLAGRAGGRKQRNGLGGVKSRGRQKPKKSASRSEVRGKGRKKSGRRRP